MLVVWFWFLCDLRDLDLGLFGFCVFLLVLLNFICLLCYWWFDFDVLHSRFQYWFQVACMVEILALEFDALECFLIGLSFDLLHVCFCCVWMLLACLWTIWIQFEFALVWFLWFHLNGFFYFFVNNDLISLVVWWVVVMMRRKQVKGRWSSCWSVAACCIYVCKIWEM